MKLIALLAEHKEARRFVRWVRRDVHEPSRGRGDPRLVACETRCARVIEKGIP